MNVSFAEYIDRPGIVKGSATNSMIRLVKADYRQRFDALYIRESALIVHKKFKDEKDNSYYIYIKMPSETVKEFFYDVVIQFKPTKAEAVLNVNLDRYNVKFFSNDPAFLFTYAYAFNKAGLLIDWLKLRLSKEALNTKPVVRNPKADTGYVKSLYFAYYFMTIRKLFDINNTAWKSATELNKRMLINEIPPFDDKLKRGKRLRDFQKEKIKQRKLEESQKKVMPFQTDHIKSSTRSATSNTINKNKASKIVGVVKNSRTIKKK
jgi:hypothetical protein